MAELTVPPLLAHVPELSPPSRRRVLILPALLAIIGILIASAAAISGQDLRREVENVRIQRDIYRAETELSEAQVRQDSPEVIAKLGQIVEAQKARTVSSYAQFGRQFTQWDGWRYEEIATRGYMYHQPNDPDNVQESSVIHVAGEVEPRLKNVVWYPLYPLIAEGVSKSLGISVNSALTVVSQTCIILAAVVSFLYARRHYYNRMPRLTGVSGGGGGVPALAEQHPTRRWDLSPQDTAALWAVAALLYGPCSIFLYANFTESLFVLLLVSFLYCLQGRWWWRAAMIAAIASSCRSQGVLFGPILALVFLFRGDARTTVGKFAVATVLGVVSAIGLICYMMYLQFHFGNAFAFCMRKVRGTWGFIVRRFSRR